MCQHCRVLASARSDGNFFAGVEEVVTCNGVMDFCFEDMVEAFFAEFLESLWSL